jgi:hypothetical protein
MQDDVVLLLILFLFCPGLRSTAGADPEDCFQPFHSILVTNKRAASTGFVGDEACRSWGRHIEEATHRAHTCSFSQQDTDLP